MPLLTMSFDDIPVEALRTPKTPLYTYRIFGIVDSNAWFVFRHRVIPGKGRRKAEIVLDWRGDNIEGRFETKEEAIALRDKLEEAAKQCHP